MTDAGIETGPRPKSDAASRDGQTGVEPFAPAVGCAVPPEGGIQDASADAPVADAGADATGCVDCQPAYVTRVIGSNVFVTDTYPACCTGDGGTAACGVLVDEQCHARDQAGVPNPACPEGCCRMDGTCGVQASRLGLGCIASDNAPPVTCRAASGPHPGPCGCASCSEEIAACSANGTCAAVVACRAGRTQENPADREGYTLADALDACLARAGCARLDALGLCREPCPSGTAGGHLVLVDMVGCCRGDGLCGALADGQCVLYDDPPFSNAPRSLSGPPPTCRATAFPHADACACGSCKDALLECGRDAACVAISECRLETGCRGAGCGTADTCGTLIEEQGGSQGQAALRAFAVETCLEGADCEVQQFGYCR